MSRRGSTRSFRLGSSHSLDAPIFLPSRSQHRCSLQDFLSDGRDREEERYFLYLPRNLSCCRLCAESIQDHVQRKVRHLTAKLGELKMSPTGLKSILNESENSYQEPEKTRIFDPFDSTLVERDEDEIEADRVLAAERNSYQEEVKKEHGPISILRKTIRAKSFPPPAKEQITAKKVVRFADSLGLELESIRHLMHMSSDRDLPPYIPSRAFADLHQTENSLELEADFQNPSALVDFEYRLNRQRVCLHSVRPTYTNTYGLVTVLNLTFHKKVFVRYSTNQWKSSNDVVAAYVSSSADGRTDRFSFNIFTCPNDFYGSRLLSLDFALCFVTEKGQEYWDNNGGENYAMSGYYKPVTFSGKYKHSWVHFL